MKKKTKIFLAVLLVLAVALAGGGIWLSKRWDENKPYASYNMKKYIQLGEYTGLEGEFTEADLSDKRIEELTELYFKASGVSILKEDAAKETVQKGDFVNIGFEATVPDISEHTAEGLRRDKWEQEVGTNPFIPGFDEQLIGHGREEEFEFKLKFPADHFNAELAGKEGTFLCVVHAIGTMDISDERATALKTPDGRGMFQSLEELQTYLKEELVRKAVISNEETLRDIAFENAKVLQFPERELEFYLGLLEKKAQANGKTSEEYLAGINYEGGVEGYAEEIKGAIERELFMFAVAEEEGLRVTSKEFDSYIETLRGGDANVTNAQIYETHGSRGEIIRAMTAGKVAEFLAEHAKNYPKQAAAAQ